MPQVGKKAPSFSLADQDGKVRRLADFSGKWVLLYFYPKDSTPGCTLEACSLRDAYADYRKAGIEVLGVSVDPVKSHAKFAAKFRLPFALLADEEKDVVEKYGVWGKKKFMGREYMGTKRWSFLISPEGRIAKIYEDVKPLAHAAEVLADVRSLDTGKKK